MTVSNLQLAALAELLFCWLVWALAFIYPFLKSRGQIKAVTDRRSRIGILGVMIGFMCAGTYIGTMQLSRPAAALIASMAVAPFAAGLGWWATRRLGKQWRYVAALTQGHELVTTGPYRLIRHPIYASMFGLLLATVFAWSWWPLGIAAVVFYVIGTEIRIRSEDALLAARFGEQFSAWRAKTPAYIPFIR
ncbi:MAG: methyltransferase family protein [Terracidiphilus sp.]